MSENEKSTLEFAESVIRKADGSGWSTADGIIWVAVADLRFVDNDRASDSLGYDADSLLGLAASIEMDGLLTPPTVSGQSAGKYNLTAGYRRVKAMHDCLDAAYVPVYVRQMDDARASHIMLAENTNRVQLGDMELAHAVANRIETGESVDTLAKVTGLKADKLERTAKFVNLIAGFAERLTRFDREAANGEAKQFTPEHAVVLLDKWQVDAEKQELCLRYWQQATKAPTIHAWRTIVKDPQAALDKLAESGDVAITGPDAITGVSPMVNGTPALELNAKFQPGTFFETNITTLRANARSQMTSIEVALVDLKKTEHWPLIQELLKANQAAVAAETLANVYNILVTRKAVRLTGNENLPRTNPTLKAGEHVRTFTTDKAKAPKSTPKGEGKDGKKK